MLLLPFSRKVIVTSLATAVLFFAVVHLAAMVVEFASGDVDYFTRRHLGTIRLQFDLEGEANLTTWYSSITLLLCAVLLQNIAHARRLTRDPWAGHWTFLAVVFVLASIDEVAMMHEAMTVPLHNLLHTSGVFYYAWVVVALPVVAGLGLASLRFLASLPRRRCIEFVVAGGVFLSGALGLEMVEGVIATQGGEGTLLMVLARWLEEVLEMVGVLLFVRALLSFSASDRPSSVAAAELQVL